jgi:hypothetical protein
MKNTWYSLLWLLQVPWMVVKHRVMDKSTGRMLETFTAMPLLAWICPVCKGEFYAMSQRPCCYKRKCYIVQRRSNGRRTTDTVKQ